MLGHELGELQRERSMGLAGNRVHDQRCARVASVLELGLHLLVQQQLHELQRDLRQRADRHQQLWLVRPRVYEQRLPERELHVQLIVVPQLSVPAEQVLQEGQHLRLRVPEPLLPVARTSDGERYPVR
jgi:hypothetical protein